MCLFWAQLLLSNGCPSTLATCRRPDWWEPLYEYLVFLPSTISALACPYKLLWKVPSHSPNVHSSRPSSLFQIRFSLRLTTLIITKHTPCIDPIPHGDPDREFKHQSENFLLLWPHLVRRRACGAAPLPVGFVRVKLGLRVRPQHQQELQPRVLLRWRAFLGRKDYPRGGQEKDPIFVLDRERRRRTRAGPSRDLAAISSCKKAEHGTVCEAEKWNRGSKAQFEFKVVLEV